MILLCSITINHCKSYRNIKYLLLVVVFLIIIIINIILLHVLIMFIPTVCSW